MSILISIGLGVAFAAGFIVGAEWRVRKELNANTYPARDIFSDGEGNYSRYTRPPA